jgi:hypothetical protein
VRGLEPALNDLDAIADCRVFYRHDRGTVYILYGMRGERR